MTVAGRPGGGRQSGQPGLRLERHAGTDSGAVGRPGGNAASVSDIAGPDAIFRVDSFEGQQLPPKSQIKSIHVTRDQFAAETEQPGSTFVDVITQPGIGPIRGSANLSFRDGSMSARSQFTPNQGTASRLGLRSQHRRRAGQGEEQFLDLGQRTEPVHHAEPERRAADREAIRRA